MNVLEIWKDIPGYEGLYQISNYGKVKKLIDRYRNIVNRILKPGKDTFGYLQVDLCKSGKQVRKSIHHLVMEAFIGPKPKGMERRHVDGNKINNFIQNLVYGSRCQNRKDAIKHGTANHLKWIRSNHPNSKLNEKQIRIINWLLKDGYLSQKEIGKIFNVSQTAIYYIKANINWKSRNKLC